jgi:hypothetical protein
LFFLLLGVPVAAAHYYMWRRLVRDTTQRGSRGRRWGTVALSVAFLLLAGAIASRPLPPEIAAVVAWPGYIWLGMTLYLTLVLAVLEIPRMIVNRRALRVEQPVPVAVGADIAEPQEKVVGTSRRVFIARSFALAGGLGAAGIVGYGTSQALGTPNVNTVPVTLSKLNPAMSGFRIAVVSDIHLGPLLGRGRALSRGWPNWSGWA